jgi:hypothetical protein
VGGAIVMAREPDWGVQIHMSGHSLIVSSIRRSHDRSLACGNARNPGLLLLNCGRHCTIRHWHSIMHSGHCGVHHPILHFGHHLGYHSIMHFGHFGGHHPTLNHMGYHCVIHSGHSCQAAALSALLFAWAAASKD